MRKMKNVLKLMVIVPALFLLFSCNPLEDDSKSNSLLLIVKIVGTDIEDSEANFLESDVVDVGTDGNPSYADDAAVVTFTAKTLDPMPMFEDTSVYSNIFVERYIVSYIRSDGKSLEGVDVPYAFEGAMSALVEVDAEENVSFIIVRAIAKLEPPLVDLAQGRGEGQLNLTAKIDFYGKDTLGNTVKATGYLSIFFADYAEQETGGGGEGQ